MSGPQIACCRALVDLARNTGQRSHRGQLAGKSDPASAPRPVKRLLAQPVAHQHQLAAVAPPGAEGEHPEQLGQQGLGAPFGEAIGDHFAIAMAAKLPPKRRKLGPDFSGVVEFAVVSQHHPAVVAGDRLGAGLAQVDDREAAVDEPGTCRTIPPDIGAIGPAPGDPGAHRVDQGARGGFGQPAPVDQSCNSAHGPRTLSNCGNPLGGSCGQSQQTSRLAPPAAPY